MLVVVRSMVTMASSSATVLKTLTLRLPRQHPKGPAHLRFPRAAFTRHPIPGRAGIRKPCSSAKPTSTGLVRCWLHGTRCGCDIQKESKKMRADPVEQRTGERTSYHRTYEMLYEATAEARQARN